MTGPKWKRPAVFGAFDGLTCLLGVLFPLLHDPHLVLHTALGVGLAETVGMAAGEWQSESDNGLGASLVIGAAAGCGAVVPALPFGFLPAGPARWVSIVLLLTVTGLIAALRAERRGQLRAWAESFGILAAVALVVWLGMLLSGGSP
jgi:VIT1/CCC1 family predicted Fe2+/Mn2+ transporter